MGLFDAIGGLVGGGDGGASATQRKALEEFSKIEIPDPEELKVKLEGLVRQGMITPEQAKAYLVDKTAMSDVRSDPQALNAARKALEGLTDVYEQGGMTDIDRARMSDIQDQEAQTERGAREAITQNAQERGVGGSGLELAAQLANQQASIGRKAKQDTDVAATAQARALEALKAAGTQGTQLQGQLFGQEAEKATAADTINKFNASTQTQTGQFNTAANNAAQQANLREKQRIEDANIATKNAQQIQNKGVAQTDFNNQITKATGVGGQYDKIAQQQLDEQKRKENLGAGIFGTGATLLAMSSGGRIPGDSEEDDPENDVVPTLLSPGETVVPASIADNPEAAAEFAANPPPAPASALKTTINPIVAEMLLKKYSGNSAGAPAGTDFSPEARQKMLESTRQRDPKEIAARIIAGISDSVLNANNSRGNSAAMVSDLEARKRKEKIDAFDAGRSDSKFVRESVQQKDQDDANSEVSKAYQSLASKYTGKNPEEFAGLSATKISAILPVIEKSYQADQNAKSHAENLAALNSRKDMSFSTKEDQWQEGQWSKLTDRINGINAGSRRALGVAANNNMRADRLLITAKDPNASSQDIANIISDIQAVYKGGVPDQVSMAHGNYNTFNRKISEIMTYITSKPQSAHSPEVVKRLEEIALELKDVDNKIIKDNIGVHAVTFRKLIATDPERWQALQDSVMESTRNPEGSGAGILTATNPKTKEVIISKDGGKTWQKK